MRRSRVGPAKVSVVSKIRRTKTSAYGDRYTWSQISAAVVARDGHRCRTCGRRRGDPGITSLEADHIIPISRGGLTVMSNLWTQCNLCHNRRPFHNHMRNRK